MTFPEKFETFGGPRSEWKREIEIRGRVDSPGLKVRPWVWLSWLMSLQLWSVRVANIGTVTELRPWTYWHWTVQQTARCSASDNGSDCIWEWLYMEWLYMGVTVYGSDCIWGWLYMGVTVYGRWKGGILLDSDKRDVYCRKLVLAATTLLALLLLLLSLL